MLGGREPRSLGERQSPRGASPLMVRAGGHGSGGESRVCSERSLLSLVLRQVLQPPGLCWGPCVLWMRVARDPSHAPTDSRGDGTHSASWLLGSGGLVGRVRVVQV